MNYRIFLLAILYGIFFLWKYRVGPAKGSIQLDEKTSGKLTPALTARKPRSWFGLGDPQSPTAIKVWVSGQLSSDVKLVFHRKKKGQSAGYPRVIYAGEVDTAFQFDYYTPDDVVISIDSPRGTEGELELEAKIYGI
ncbi:hypothetical protein [Tellurirhabdus rosea]|uniref:hypothetical protein n=1 Tax=Tellurirhabdus rosea TaxID=2674997 RepID=UPI002251CE03|nr:hypothetical protein [Tellurirhabdus rosea]